MSKYSFGHDPEMSMQDADIDMANMAEAADRLEHDPHAWPWPDLHEKLTKPTDEEIIAADQDSQVRRCTMATEAIERDRVAAMAANWPRSLWLMTPTEANLLAVALDHMMEHLDDLSAEGDECLIAELMQDDEGATIAERAQIAADLAGRLASLEGGA